MVSGADPSRDATSSDGALLCHVRQTGAATIGGRHGGAMQVGDKNPLTEYISMASFPKDRTCNRASGCTPLLVFGDGRVKGGENMFANLVDG